MFDQKLRDKIQQNLCQFERAESTAEELTLAAVVIGISLLKNSTSASILLTQRSSTLRQHAGQFALPGGKVDSGESIVEAALRELQEELGIKEDKNSVLGFLDDMPTQSGFNITPVVVWINNLEELKPNPGEVAEVYQIPLQELQSMKLNISQDDSDQEKTDQHITPEDHTKNQSDASENNVMSLYLPSVGTTIFSPTAAIIYQFREIALLGRTTRVAHFGQPRFAWR